MRLLILFTAYLFIGCTSNNENEYAYAVDLQISESASISINNVYLDSTKSIGIPPLESNVGVYQLALRNEQNKSLFGLPDIYLSHPGIYKFSIKSSFNADTLSVYQMDGSSGHFSLKNQSPLQSVKITK